MTKLQAISTILSCCLAVAAWPNEAAAAQFADKVISYVPGSGVGAAYTNPAAALGSPDDLTGEGLGFPNVLSPFSPAFESDEIVQIGGGGHLTLRLSHYAIVGPGHELGVIENVGLVDTNFPSGQAGNPAATFNAVEDSAIVEVSPDGVAWSPLNAGSPLLFNVPAVYYLNAGPFDNNPPESPLLADFGLPFTPAAGLAAFNGLSYAQIIALLGGSGGGTWLDLSGTGLAQVGYVRFSVPMGGNLSLDLDAVAIANSAVGAAVPEPGAGALLFVGVMTAGAILLVHRRRRSLTGASVLAALFTWAASVPPAQAGILIAENFPNDPVAAGRATITGDAARFAYSAADTSMTAHYDTFLSTAVMRWPLGVSLTPAGDFRFDVAFRIHGAGFIADPNQFGQIAFGLINSQTTGPDRPGGSAEADAYDIVTLDYFPNISPQFGGPSLTPTIIQNNNGVGYFNRIVFPPDAESKLDDDGESDLARDVPLVASIAYEAASRLTTLRIAGPNGPADINLGGGVLGQFGGPDGDPTTIQLLAPPTVSFTVDSFALTLWRDTFAPTASSARADLTFDSFAVYDSLAVPEPAGAFLTYWIAIGLGATIIARHRRIARRPSSG